MKLFPFVIALFFSSPSFAESPFSCDETTHQSRAAEIQKIVQADQDDRTNGQMTLEVVARDRKRRMRIGEIFGEGCFKTAKDFSAAALVYQHGNSPDHFFQTFIWSKRAYELGDASQKRMMGLGIDRYLVNIGMKQLFASQASKPNGKDCWCLEPVEKTFPDDRRKDIVGRSLSEAFKWVDDLNKNTNCPAAVECERSFKPTPAGSTPGFW